MTFKGPLSQSAERTSEFTPAKLPPALVERAREGAQRNLGAAEPEPASVEPCGSPADPPPQPARRLTDWSESDLDQLVSHRLAEAQAAGFAPQHPKAWRAAVRARELQHEAEAPGWIRNTAEGLRRRSRGVS